MPGMIMFVFCSTFTIFLLQIANSLNNSLFIGEAKTQKLIAVPKIILSQDLKTTFKQNLTCMKKTQYMFSFIHFVVDDPVACTAYLKFVKLMQAEV